MICCPVGRPVMEFFKLLPMVFMTFVWPHISKSYWSVTDVNFFYLFWSLGDILLNVNGIDLTGVSRSEAVSLLKNPSSSCVVLRALETKEYEPEEDLSNNSLSMDSVQNSFESREWSPVWVMWLKLPRYVKTSHPISYRRVGGKIYVSWAVPSTGFIILYGDVS